MSISRDGCASRSFIIGIRLWPPATTRESSCSRSDAIAPWIVDARSYSNGAGVCIFGLVLDGCVGADHRRAAGAVGRVQAARGAAAVAGVAQGGPVGAGRGERRLAPQAGERERAARVDGADPWRSDGRAVGEVAQARLLGAGIEAVDQPHRLRQAGLLHQQTLERVDGGVEVGVDLGDDRVDRLGLGDDLADRPDRLVEALRDLLQLEDHGHEEVHEREHDQEDREDEQCGRHQASSTITSSEPPNAATFAKVSLTWRCVVSSRRAASRSLLPAWAARWMRSIAGVMAFASLRTLLRRITTTGSTISNTTSATTIIAASARPRPRPWRRCPAGRTGWSRTGR